jgi:cob(I)alamin adenosyltransferase
MDRRELNSYIGLVRDQEMNTHYKEILSKYKIAYLHLGLLHLKKRSEEKTGNFAKKKLGNCKTDIELLENEIDSMEVSYHK